MEKGLILESLGGLYTVETESGIVQLKARGIFRKDGLSPCAGDRCTVEGGVISSIDERKNSIIIRRWQIWTSWCWWFPSLTRLRTPLFWIN